MGSDVKSTNVTLYRGWPESGVYAWSPFVTKLEARFRFGRLSYKAEPGSMSKAPRGKVPYVAVWHDDETGSPKLLSDSTLIASTFGDQGLLENINDQLSPVKCVEDLAIRALLEEKLYFYQTHERWVENFYSMRDTVLGFMPYPIRVFVGLLAFRKVSATLAGQGTGRFSIEQISDNRKHIWAAINDLVTAAKKKSTSKKKPFWALGGSGPTEVDATLYGFIVSGLTCNAAPETMGVIQSYPLLVEYATRIHEHYFPEYTKWK